MTASSAPATLLSRFAAASSARSVASSTNTLISLASLLQLSAVKRACASKRFSQCPRKSLSSLNTSLAAWSERFSAISTTERTPASRASSIDLIFPSSQPCFSNIAFVFPAKTFSSSCTCPKDSSTLAHRSVTAPAALTASSIVSKRSANSAKLCCVCRSRELISSKMCCRASSTSLCIVALMDSERASKCAFMDSQAAEVFCESSSPRLES
mmetsp:Transcript_38430/g.59806  ORF Transcript_38430/g.59806 Transcript_38430/m.59806 type:complete len:212 (+) Transcript_38430:1043-1678(+)